MWNGAFEIGFRLRQKKFRAAPKFRQQGLGVDDPKNRFGFDNLFFLCAETNNTKPGTTLRRFAMKHTFRRTLSTVSRKVRDYLLNILKISYACHDSSDSNALRTHKK